MEEKKENKTGLPDTLKAGIEYLSGLSLDDVRVHYNSTKPARVGAAAFAQGAEIHVGPGRKDTLPHEAWHVVQQKQGRVMPTRFRQGVVINDDPSLEREATSMGGRVNIESFHKSQKSPPLAIKPHQAQQRFTYQGGTVIQRIDYRPQLQSDIAEIEKAIPDFEAQLKTVNDELKKHDKMSDEYKKLFTTRGELSGKISDLKKYRTNYEQSAIEVHGQAEKAEKDTGKKKLYLGRTDDTKKSLTSNKSDIDKSSRVLHAEKWSLGVNDAFMQGGVDLGARFKLKTSFTEAAKKLIKESKSGSEFLNQLEKSKDIIDKNLFDPNTERRYTVTSREIAQLIDEKYVFDDIEAANPAKPASFQAFKSRDEMEKFIKSKEEERGRRAKVSGGIP